MRSNIRKQKRTYLHTHTYWYNRKQKLIKSLGTRTHENLNNAAANKWAEATNKHTPISEALETHTWDRLIGDYQVQYTDHPFTAKQHFKQCRVKVTKWSAYVCSERSLYGYSFAIIISIYNLFILFLKIVYFVLRFACFCFLHIYSLLLQCAVQIIVARGTCVFM